MRPKAGSPRELTGPEMKVIELLRTESDAAVYILIAVGLISGFSNALLLIIINQAAENDASGADNSRMFILCVVCVVIYLLSNWHVQRKSTQQIEGLVQKIRVRIANKIRHSELQAVEELGQSEVYARITNDTSSISWSIETMVQAFQSAILVLFSFIYIGYMSLPALVIIGTVIVMGALSFYRTAKVSSKAYEEASRKETQFFDALKGILHGFKELKINTRKNNGAFWHFKRIMQEATNLRIQATFSMINSNLISRSLFYIMLMAIIFIIPAYHAGASQSVVKISAAILFIIGPLEGVIGAIPDIMQSNVAALNIDKLEQKIETAMAYNSATEHEAEAEAETPSPLAFEREVRVQNLQFEYPRKYDADGFSVGPVNLTIPKGQLLFITGGNGSGKSTTLKLLCGLYYPKAGQITVDGVRVTQQNYQQYRELLSIILTDFHLFDRLLGLSDIDQEHVNELLTLMRINDKTQIIDGVITELNLSTGQRKRVALVVSMLEDKAIYVFDEIAADQDPTFKHFFYTEILPQMKAQRKTIIVVSHDDHYFHVADVCYKLQDGLFTTLKPKKP